MCLRKTTLYEYKKFLIEYDGTPEIGESMCLSPHAMELKLAKLRLATEPLVDSDKSTVREYFPLLGDALVYLFPDRTVAELRRCANEEVNPDPA